MTTNTSLFEMVTYMRFPLIMVALISLIFLIFLYLYIKFAITNNDDKLARDSYVHRE